MKDPNLKGVWPALIVPVDESGGPEFQELEKLVHVLLREEMDGLYVLGSTGQGFLFNEAQRIEISRKIIKWVNNAVPVIVQVGALNTNESIRLARAAEQDGAYGISSVAPIYYSLSTERVFEHYHAIGASVSIPFFPYHVGNQSIFANNSAVEYVDRILGLPNIKGMKVTTQNLYEIGILSNLSKGRLTLFSGADELMCQAAMCGTDGAIGSFYNLWGKECRMVRKAFLDGKVKESSEFMLMLQDIINQVIPDIWSFLRQAFLIKYDINIGLPNPPLGYRQAPWDDKLVKEILARVDDNFNKNF